MKRLLIALICSSVAFIAYAESYEMDPTADNAKSSVIQQTTTPYVSSTLRGGLNLESNQYTYAMIGAISLLTTILIRRTSGHLHT